MKDRLSIHSPLTLLAPLRPPDAAGEAAFLRRDSQQLLFNTDVAQGEMEYLRRLLGILQDTRAAIAAAEGEPASTAWHKEQVTYLRHFLPGGSGAKNAPVATGAHWAWIVGEMEKP